MDVQQLRPSEMSENVSDIKRMSKNMSKMSENKTVGYEEAVHPEKSGHEIHGDDVKA